MQLSPKKLIITVVAIFIVITGATLVAYNRASLIHFDGIIDKDYFPAFGSFIGGSVGIILSFASFILIYYTYQSQQEQLTVTRNLVNRQIALTVKPDLVVSDLYTTNELDCKSEDEETFDGFLPIQLQYIQLEILNVGIEVARYIKYKIEYNPLDLISYLNAHSPTAEIELDYSPGLLFGNVKRVSTGEEIFMNMLSSTEITQKDYLMPFKLEKNKILIPLPYFYVLTYYYTLVAKYKSIKSPKKDLTLDNFPQCLLKTS